MAKADILTGKVSPELQGVRTERSGALYQAAAELALGKEADLDFTVQVGDAAVNS